MEWFSKTYVAKENRQGSQLRCETLEISNLIKLMRSQKRDWTHTQENH